MNRFPSCFGSRVAAHGQDVFGDCGRRCKHACDCVATARCHRDDSCCVHCVKHCPIKGFFGEPLFVFSLFSVFLFRLKGLTGLTVATKLE